MAYLEKIITKQCIIANEIALKASRHYTAHQLTLSFPQRQKMIEGTTESIEDTINKFTLELCEYLSAHLVYKKSLPTTEQGMSEWLKERVRIWSNQTQ